MSRIGTVIISVLILQAVAEDTYSSQSQPDFYNGEDGTFTCSFAVDLTSDILGKIIGFNVLRKSASAGPFTLGGCIVSTNPTGEVSVTATNTLTTGDACTAAYNKMAKDGSATLTVPVNLEDTGEYYCSYWTSDQYFDNDVIINVEQLKVAPTSLTTNFKPTAYSGEQVTFTCASEGGNPEAQLVYAVDGMELAGEVEPFAASKEDNGKLFSCEDKSHVNYMGGQAAETYASQTLNVYYFESTKPEEVKMEVNPTISYTLSCPTVSNPSLNDSDIMYSWTRDETESVGGDQIDLVIVQDPAINKTLNETYTCTATAADTNLEAVSIKYIVTWDVETSTPTSPATTTSELTTKPVKDVPVSKETLTENEGGPTMIIIIVVVVITVIILIVVIVIIVIKKRSTNSAAMSKEAAQQPVKKDAEAGNGEEVTEPMLSKKSEEGGGGKPIEEAGKQ